MLQLFWHFTFIQCGFVSQSPLSAQIGHWTSLVSLQVSTPFSCINKSKENSRYHREERSSIKWPKNPLFLTCLHSFHFSLARDTYDSIAFTFLAIFSVKTFRAQADIILPRHSAFTSIQAWFWKTRANCSPDWRTYTCQDKINIS